MALGFLGRYHAVTLGDVLLSLGPRVLGGMEFGIFGLVRARSS